MSWAAKQRGAAPNPPQSAVTENDQNKERSHNGSATKLTDPADVTDQVSRNEVNGLVCLDVTLPNGQRVDISVDQNTPMLDLLVSLAAKSKLNPTGLALILVSEHTGKALSYKPNQTIGALGGRVVHIVNRDVVSGKSSARDSKHERPFEVTHRFTVNFPRGQKTVVRISPQITLAELLTTVCQDKGLDLDLSKYVLQIPGQPGISVDLGATVQQVGVYEMNLVTVAVSPDSKQTVPVADLSKPTVANDRSLSTISPAGDQQKKKGLLSFLGKKDKKHKPNIQHSIESSPVTTSIHSSVPPPQATPPGFQKQQSHSENKLKRPESVLVPSITPKDDSPSLQQDSPHTLVPAVKKRRAPTPPVSSAPVSSILMHSGNHVKSFSEGNVQNDISGREKTNTENEQTVLYKRHAITRQAANDQEQVSPSSSVAHQQLPPSSGVAHQQLPPSSGVEHQQLPPSAGVAHQQLPPSSGVAHEQLPPSAGVVHQQLPPSASVVHQQLPPSASVINQQLPPSAGVINQQLPHLELLNHLHSRNSSDSSGYHELTLSGCESPEARHVSITTSKTSIDTTSIESYDKPSGVCVMLESPGGVLPIVELPESPVVGLLSGLVAGSTDTLPSSKKRKAPAPPTAQTSTAAPPTAQTSTAAPPTAHTSTAAPPTAQTSTAAPPTAQTSTAAPPTAQTSTAAPPTAQTSTAYGSAETVTALLNNTRHGASAITHEPLKASPEVTQEPQTEAANDAVANRDNGFDNKLLDTSPGQDEDEVLDRAVCDGPLHSMELIFSTPSGRDENDRMMMMETASVVSENVEQDAGHRPCSFFPSPPPLDTPHEEQAVEILYSQADKMLVEKSGDISGENTPKTPCSTDHSPKTVRARKNSHVSVTSVDTVEGISLDFQQAIQLGEEAFSWSLSDMEASFGYKSEMALFVEQMSKLAVEKAERAKREQLDDSGSSLSAPCSESNFDTESVIQHHQVDSISEAGSLTRREGEQLRSVHLRSVHLQTDLSECLKNVQEHSVEQPIFCDEMEPAVPLAPPPEFDDGNETFKNKRSNSDTIMKRHGSIDERNPSSIDEINYSSIDERRHSSTDERNPSSVDERQHSSIDERNPSSIDEINYSSVDERQHSSTDERNHSSVDERQHSSTNERNHSSTYERNHSSISERNPSSLDKREHSSKDERNHSSSISEKTNSSIDDGSHIQDNKSNFTELVHHSSIKQASKDTWKFFISDTFTDHYVEDRGALDNNDTFTDQTVKGRGTGGNIDQTAKHRGKGGNIDQTAKHRGKGGNIDQTAKHRGTGGNSDTFTDQTVKGRDTGGNSDQMAKHRGTGGNIDTFTDQKVKGRGTGVNSDISTDETVTTCEPLVKPETFTDPVDCSAALFRQASPSQLTAVEPQAHSTPDVKEEIILTTEDLSNVTFLPPKTKRIKPIHIEPYVQTQPYARKSSVSLIMAKHGHLPVSSDGRTVTSPAEVVQVQARDSHSLLAQEAAVNEKSQTGHELPSTEPFLHAAGKNTVSKEDIVNDGSIDPLLTKSRPRLLMNSSSNPWRKSTVGQTELDNSGHKVANHRSSSYATETTSSSADSKIDQQRAPVTVSEHKNMQRASSAAGTTTDVADTVKHQAYRSTDNIISEKLRSEKHHLNSARSPSVAASKDFSSPPREGQVSTTREGQISATGEGQISAKTGGQKSITGVGQIPATRKGQISTTRVGQISTTIVSQISTLQEDHIPTTAKTGSDVDKQRLKSTLQPQLDPHEQLLTAIRNFPREKMKSVPVQEGAKQ